MGTRHYHYLIPLTPFFSLNVARLGLVLNRRCFSFVIYFTGLLGLMYLLGMCAILLTKNDLSQLSSCFLVVVFAFCSILCLYIFTIKVFHRRKLKVVPFFLLCTIFSTQYLSLSALAAGGVILSTNKQLKSLAKTVNVDCKSSGAYLYGLDGKDMTVLRFYLDRPYILESLDDLHAMSRRCLVIKESAAQKLPKQSLNDKFSNIYFK